MTNPMMSNLEGISFGEVVNSKGLSYSVFRQSLKPDYHKTWLYIAGGFVWMASLVVIFILTESKIPDWFFLTIPVFSILLGFTIAYLNLFIHEAGHYHLHPDRQINDLLANIFLCSWTGLDIKVYRKIHWLHHQHLATADDTENSYFNALSRRLIIESLTGIHVARLILNKNKKGILDKELRKRSAKMLLAGFTINLILVFIAVWFQYYQIAIVWILSMMVFFPFFATLRQLLEHRDELASIDNQYYLSPRRKISRLFTDGVFSRLFGAAGFNKHIIHHWDPVLPFTTLGEAEIFLSDCERTKQILKSSRTTYFAAFKKLWYRAK